MTHLPRTFSDHCLILIELCRVNVNQQNKPFVSKPCGNSIKIFQGLSSKLGLRIEFYGMQFWSLLIKLKGEILRCLGICLLKEENIS